MGTSIDPGITDMTRSTATLALRTIGTALCLLAGTISADAKCARLGFSVNDYGKEGPTKDAKALLDKHIAAWTASRGITKYTTGKKDVTCELFLDFGVFDEHTCKASATVCWGGNAPVAPVGTKAEPANKVAPAKAPKASPAEAPAKAKPKAT